MRSTALLTFLLFSCEAFVGQITLRLADCSSGEAIVNAIVISEAKGISGVSDVNGEVKLKGLDGERFHINVLGFRDTAFIFSSIESLKEICLVPTTLLKEVKITSIYKRPISVMSECLSRYASKATNRVKEKSYSIHYVNHNNSGMVLEKLRGDIYVKFPDFNSSDPPFTEFCMSSLEYCIGEDQWEDEEYYQILQPFPLRNLSFSFVFRKDNIKKRNKKVPFDSDSLYIQRYADSLVFETSIRKEDRGYSTTSNWRFIFRSDSSLSRITSYVLVSYKDSSSIIHSTHYDTFFDLGGEMIPEVINISRHYSQYQQMEIPQVSYLECRMLKSGCNSKVRRKINGTRLHRQLKDVVQYMEGGTEGEAE